MPLEAQEPAATAGPSLVKRRATSQPTSRHTALVASRRQICAAVTMRCVELASLAAGGKKRQTSCKESVPVSHYHTPSRELMDHTHATVLLLREANPCVSIYPACSHRHTNRKHLLEVNATRILSYRARGAAASGPRIAGGTERSPRASTNTRAWAVARCHQRTPSPPPMAPSTALHVTIARAQPTSTSSRWCACRCACHLQDDAHHNPT